MRLNQIRPAETIQSSILPNGNEQKKVFSLLKRVFLLLFTTMATANFE